MNQIENTTTHPAVKHALFLLVVTSLSYVATLNFPFLGLDDTPFIVQSQSVHQWSSVPSFFAPSADVVADRQRRNLANFYRPAVSLWILLQYKLLGLHPLLWRCTALALYGCSVWLFWKIVQKLTQDDFVSLAAALLFALHPLHVEGVAWLSGACVELLLWVFFCGGFLAYMHWRETERPSWLVLCAVLILLALLSKETGAALLVLIVAHALIFRRRRDGAGPWRWLPLGLSVAVPVMVYAFLRVVALHTVAISASRHNWGEVLLSTPLFFVVYIEHVVWPVHLANWYDLQIVSSATWARFYLPLTFCLVYAGLTVWAILRKPLLAFLLLWWAVPLVPALVAIRTFVDNEYMHDRFTFVALAGPCILAAIGLSRLPGTARSLFGFRASSVAGLAAWVVALASLTVMQVSTWRSDFAMTLHAVEVSPRAVRPLLLLANDMQQNNDRDSALILYRRAVTLAPDHWETLFAYGAALANDGYQTDAVRVLKRGLEVAPAKSVFYLILADIFAHAGRFDDASKLLEDGITKAEQPDLLRAKLNELEARQLGVTNGNLANQ